jgi:hypothetical protein
VAEIKGDPALKALMEDSRFEIRSQASTAGSIPKEGP